MKLIEYDMKYLQPRPSLPAGGFCQAAAQCHRELFARRTAGAGNRVRAGLSSLLHQQGRNVRLLGS